MNGSEGPGDGGRGTGHEAGDTAARESRLPAGRLVGEGPHMRLLVPEAPFNSGAIVIRPKRHVTALEALEAEELDEMALWLARVESVIERVYTPHGMNVGLSSRYGGPQTTGGGSSGSVILDEVSVLELSVVPRWNGDVNFMSVIAGVKILPVSLEETVGMYRDALFGE